MIWIVLLAALTTGAAATELDIRDDYSPYDRLRPVRRETRLLILHTTEGGDASAQREVRRRGLANYLVLRTGRVLRIVHHRREARHAGTSMWDGAEDLDEVSVAIEVAGYHDRPITDAQAAALSELVRQLKDIYDLDDDAVLPHAMVAFGEPNRWHSSRHRGRKRCGMQFARQDLRERLGLTSRPARDPDVDAGRLVEGDSELAGALYGRRVASGQTAAEVAGDAYRSSGTIYVFPGGKRLRGDQVADWSAIPAGTWVLLEKP